MKTRPIMLTTSTLAPLRASIRPRRAPACRGIVGGADEAGLALDEDQRLALVEGVIAERDRVGAGGEKSSQIASVMPKPPAAFSPLTTTKSSASARAVRQMLEQHGAPAAPDDVADEQQPHQPVPRVDEFALGQDEIERSSCGSSGTPRPRTTE
jgi:hypothetical protein